jgi:hypothetical protein
MSELPELLRGTISEGYTEMMEAAWLANEPHHEKKTHKGTECTNRGGACQIDPTCDTTEPDCSVDQPTCGGDKPEYKAFQPALHGWSMPPQLPLR